MNIRILIHSIYTRKKIRFFCLMFYTLKYILMLPGSIFSERQRERESEEERGMFV